MYTNHSQDSNFILDTLGTNKNVVIGAGFSGHGFKFGPLIGELLSSLAMEESPEFDLQPFSIARLSV